MKSDSSTPCALFFCVWGVMILKNQTFMKETTTSRMKKLDVVLRQVAGDTFTSEQRLRLTRALGHRRQYLFHLCPSRQAFLRAVNSARSPNEDKKVRILLDDRDAPEPAPLAALVGKPGCGESTVYLYLPKRREAARNGPRATKKEKE